MGTRAWARTPGDESRQAIELDEEIDCQTVLTQTWARTLGLGSSISSDSGDYPFDACSFRPEGLSMGRPLHPGVPREASVYDQVLAPVYRVISSPDL